MFKKTCYACGAKVEKLYDSKCIDCFKQDHPPIEEVKPIKLKICNQSKQICYRHTYYDPQEIEHMIPDIVRKHIDINPYYTLEELRVNGFEIDGHRVTFDIEVECELED